MKRALLLALLFMPLGAGQVADPTYDWPQHGDVTAAMDDAASSPWVTIRQIGSSTQAKPLRLLEITDPESTVPMEQRVVTLITTQQHGNEPAGTPAALQLIDDIVAGNVAGLDNQVLLLWPQANPDGAAANSRGNGNGVDLNRDHVLVHQPEAQALHQVVLQTWDVHVGMDHHEYSGTGPGYPVPVRTYDWDATILYPRHGNVREPTQTQAESLYDALVAGLDEHSYEAGEYGVQTVAGVPVSHIAGGPDPGILRNNFGLNNVAGLLVETFVNSGNPLVTPERRIDIHYQVMLDTIEYASDHAGALIAAKRSSELLNVESPMEEYLEVWPADPVTGEANSGDRRGPIAAAYATQDNLTDIMARHGFSADLALETNGKWSYLVAGERQGLLAAMLHPASSRRVAETTSANGFVIGPVEPTETDAPTTATPGLPIAVLLVGLLLLARRQ